jgi:hypothetical protein
MVLAGVAGDPTGTIVVPEEYVTGFISVLEDDVVDMVAHESGATAMCSLLTKHKTRRGVSKTGLLVLPNMVNLLVMLWCQR